MRVAWWSPLPPQRSGIADYSAMLLPHLAQELEIVAVVDDLVASQVSAPAGVPIVPASRYLAGDAGSCAVDIYQMGNHHQFHGYMHGPAIDRPGVLVLHDLSLLDFYLVLCGGPDRLALLEEAHYNDSSVLGKLPETVCGGSSRLDHMTLQLSRRLVEASCTTVVHSLWAEAEIRRHNAKANVVMIHSPAPLLGGWPPPPRQGPNAVVFGVLGGLARQKRLPVVLEAFASVHRHAPGQARLLIAGRGEDLTVVDTVRRMIALLSLEGAVDLSIDPSPEGFERAIFASDVVVSLRGPTVGETSAGLMRSLGAGKPVIVSDLPQYRDLDRAFCWPVPTDSEREVAALAALMEEVVGDRSRCTSGGEAAREFAISHASPPVVAQRYAAVIKECAAASPSRIEVPPRSSPPAAEVNAFGDWTATTGLAEASRRSVKALLNSGVRVWLNDREVPGLPRAAARMPHELRELRPGRHGPIDLWYLNVHEFPVIGETELRPTGSRRHVIGHWFWELPVVATRLAPQVRRVDELWVGSKFTAAAFRGHTDKPVYVMPQSVQATPDPRLRRADFDLPNSACLFFFHFDAASSPARKNPWSVLRAFRRAFDGSMRQSQVKLVIKTINLTRLPEAHERLTRELAAVGGILIDEDLATPTMDALINLCDVYVSLHRCEGFGLGMAEAMLMGLPVVATAYSGNMDFMSQANSCLTGYRLRAITDLDVAHHPGLELVYEIGQLWAEPNVDHAARWMRWLYENPSARRRIGALGAATIRKRYSQEAAGTAMTARLAELSTDVGAAARWGA